MGVIQDTDTIAYLFLHQLSHTLSKRTGVTNGSPFADARSKSNGVSALFYQRTGPQHRFFSGAAAAVDEAHSLNIILSHKSAFSLSDCPKIPASGAVILCLHTTNNAKFHISFLLNLGPAIQIWPVHCLLLCNQIFQQLDGNVLVVAILFNHSQNTGYRPLRFSV